MPTSNIADTKDLIDLAERMGIPTKDAVGGLVIQLLDHTPPLDDESRAALTER